MFRIHRGERADALVDALGELVSVPLADPFEPEIVAVPTHGVERWLTHRLGGRLGTSPGGRDGVCANLAFPYPGRLVSEALAAATGIDRDEDPWRTERLVWPLLEVIDDYAGEEWLRLIGLHIGTVDNGDGHDDLRRHRRFATARHIAELFDRYATYRPAMVRAWLDPGVADDVPDDQSWQPELYRRLAAHVEDTQGAACPPARMAEACARIEDDPDVLTLPTRLSLFGLTRLPASHVEVLRAIAVNRDVHLYALHPSLDWWQRVDAARGPELGRRRDDRTARLARHPLLRNWADDSREMQLVLASVTDATVEHHPVPPADPDDLLCRLQADIRADRPPVGIADPDRRLVLAPDDRSIQVHGCHGRMRQVEVLRDAICHLLADDETLEPRDVIVMCPDIEQYAPIIHAVFGAHSSPMIDEATSTPPNGVPRLPYRLADRALRQSNPLLDVLSHLLELVRSRLTAPEVVEFASREPVRNRFGFDDDALAQIRRWITDSGVRWGLDAEHREPWKLAKVSTNTWRTGLDRLLLGVTMDETDARLVGDHLPVDDLDSGSVDLVGCLAEYIDRLATVVEDCQGRQPLADWVETVSRALDLLTRAPGVGAWQRTQVERVLRDTLGEATSAGVTRGRDLSVTELAALLDHRLRGAATRSDFRTGAITMCTLVPMRAVPHRVVCMIGLDADAFPRVGVGDGDDLLAADPVVGDRDPRTEDRQLLLDAVLSSTGHLVVTYSARDERTNERLPPAVPLAELLDVLDHTACAPDGSPVGGAVMTEHPLQPFAPANFDATGGGPGAGRPWAFDRTHLLGAEAMRRSTAVAPRFLDTPLGPVLEDTIDLDVLIRFLQHPAREFLRQRLDATTWDDDAVLASAIPYELDGLDEWRVGSRLLGRLLDGGDIDTASEAERVRGLVPPDALGEVVLGGIRRTVEKVYAMADAIGATGPSSSQEIDVECDGIRVVGTVAGIRGELHGIVSYSSTKPKDRLAAWIRLLALSAVRPEVPWEAAVVAKRNTRYGPKPTMHRLQAIDGPPEARQRVAVETLTSLVRLRSRGLCAPLPLPVCTAEAWMTADRWKRTPEANARTEWVGSKRRPGERADAAHVRVFGPDYPFEALLALLPEPDDEGPGWDTGQTTRLGRLAHHVWAPLLAREVER